MNVKKIMCCCGSGLGSSLMVRLNVEKAIKKLGISGVEVLHSSLSDVSPRSADLFVVGADLTDFTKDFPHVILLENLMSLPELEEKLAQFFAE